MTQPVISTSELKKYYSGKTKALDGVDLDVRAEEFIAVMGASGSGKSTLLHLIAGLTRPTSGRIAVEGLDPTTMSDGALTRFRRRRIGLVFQSFNLIPHLTAKENIMIPILAEGKSRKEASRRAGELAAELRIAERLDHRPDALSGGEQQRVTLARALSLNPAILLADEPTGNLDSVSSRHICEILDNLCRNEKRTILLVTHEPTVAIWSKRLLILKDGRLIADMQTSRFGDAHHLAATCQEILEGESAKEEAVR
ncbi:MAG: ABC transporter ATP-binding protein [Thermoguttaceae bacterium]|jgi:putative ABC transport system ATP-binding protein